MLWFDEALRKIKKHRPCLNTLFDTMAKLPDKLLPESWHTYFAMQANNAAWDLAQTTADAISRLDLLDAAHASAWHWRQVGTELNHMRSGMLLAMVHSRMGMGASAWAYAQPMHAFFVGKADTPDWELAFAHVIYAMAAHANGQDQVFRDAFPAAVQSLNAIQDPEDRAVVQKTFGFMPKP